MSTACIVVVFALAPLVFWWLFATVEVRQYNTGVGEQRAITLPDHSTLTLNTNSSISVTFGSQARRIRLLRGEILIHARHDATRPLILDTGEVQIADVGTIFDVYKRGRDTRVSVIEGSVKVNCACPIDTNLVGGEQADILVDKRSPEVVRRPLSAYELQRAIAWREGYLAFNGQSVVEAVEEFNRYSNQRMVVTDPELARYHVGGVFKSTDVGGFLHFLNEQWGIRPTAGDSSTTTVIRLERSPQESARVKH